MHFTLTVSPSELTRFAPHVPSHNNSIPPD
jgi:hypothetical protein